VLAENVVRPLVKPRDDRALLLTMRLTVAALAVGITIMALTSKLSIYQLVNESGKVVLVSAFVPLAAGLFWKRATERGAHWSIAAGLVTWITLEWLWPEGTMPPALGGPHRQRRGYGGRFPPRPVTFRPAFSAFRRFPLSGAPGGSLNCVHVSRAFRRPT
jgi:Na+/proline symporter